MLVCKYHESGRASNDSEWAREEDTIIARNTSGNIPENQSEERRITIGMDFIGKAGHGPLDASQRRTAVIQLDVALS